MTSLRLSSHTCILFSTILPDTPAHKHPWPGEVWYMYVELSSQMTAFLLLKLAYGQIVPLNVFLQRNSLSLDFILYNTAEW